MPHSAFVTVPESEDSIDPIGPITTKVETLERERHCSAQPDSQRR
jgi:hypothetical protein